VGTPCGQRAPQIVPVGTYTVYDNVIRVEFDKAIENTRNEISEAVATGWVRVGGNVISVTGPSLTASAP